MTSQLALPACVIPGCTTLVTEWGAVCTTCVTEFGDMLRKNPDGAPLTEDEIRVRDAQVAAAYAQQRSTHA